MIDEGPAPQPFVDPKEIKKSVEEIVYRLKLAKLPSKKIASKLFSKKIKDKGSVSINELAKRLKRKPFDVKSDEQRTLFARYLVEEGEGELVVDLAASKNIAELLVKFQSLIGEYEVEEEIVEE